MLGLIRCILIKLPVFNINYLLNYCIKCILFIICIADHSMLIVLNNSLMNLPKFISFGSEVVVNSWFSCMYKLEYVIYSLIVVIML